jgi:hypothetical protein
MFSLLESALGCDDRVSLIRYAHKFRDIDFTQAVYCFVLRHPNATEIGAIFDDCGNNHGYRLGARIRIEVKNRRELTLDVSSMTASDLAWDYPDEYAAAYFRASKRRNTNATRMALVSTARETGFDSLILRSATKLAIKDPSLIPDFRRLQKEMREYVFVEDR